MFHGVDHLILPTNKARQSIMNQQNMMNSSMNKMTESDVLERLHQMQFDCTPDRVFYSFVLRMREDANILDVGCGTGRFLKKCIQEGYKNVAGCDPLSGYDQEEKLALSKQLQKEITFQLTRSSSLSFDNDQFDLVICNQVLEHVKDKLELVAEIVRVLKPKGSCIMSFPTSEVIVEPHVRLPLFHRVDLSNRAVRLAYRALVRLGLGSFPDGSSRQEWLSKRFVTFPKELHYISHNTFLQKVRSLPHASIKPITDEVVSALAARHPVISTCCSIEPMRSMLLSQLSRYYLLKKDR